MNITEKDIGRKVLTRGGEEGVIVEYSNTDYIEFPVIVCFEESGLYNSYTPDGSFISDLDSPHIKDLLGFVDEEEQGGEEFEPFDLEKALKGVSVVTRCGNKNVTQLTSFEVSGKSRKQLACVVDGILLVYSKDGRLSPSIDSQFDLFMKPETRVINGFEVPAPVKTPLQDFDYYYVPSIQDDRFYFRYVWTGSSVSKNCLERGLVFLTKEDAIANAKAMLGINPYGEEGN